MKENLITSYMNYKVTRLSDYGTLFFLNYDLKFVKDKLREYLRVYIDVYYYHILYTLNNSNVFDFEIVRKEIEGKKLELLDQYAGYELAVTNEEYVKYTNLIKDMLEVVMFLCEFDQLRFSSKDKIADEINEFMKLHISIKNKLGNYLERFISKVKDTYITECKFFKEETSYFEMNFFKELKKNEYFMICLNSNIKYLESNYKNTLIEKVYKNDKFSDDKIQVLIWKISKEILIRTLNKEKIDKYFIVLDDKLFQRGKLIVSEILDNPLLRRYVVFVISFNMYTSYKKYIKNNLNFNFACMQDLLYINDINLKLSTIDNELFFNYIIISDYKDKDNELLLKYECREGVEMFIIKEE